MFAEGGLMANLTGAVFIFVQNIYCSEEGIRNYARDVLTTNYHINIQNQTLKNGLILK